MLPLSSVPCTGACGRKANLIQVYPLKLKSPQSDPSITEGQNLEGSSMQSPDLGPQLLDVTVPDTAVLY